MISLCLSLLFQILASFCNNFFLDQTLKNSFPGSMKVKKMVVTLESEFESSIFKPKCNALEKLIRQQEEFMEKGLIGKVDTWITHMLEANNKLFNEYAIPWIL